MRMSLATLRRIIREEMRPVDKLEQDDGHDVDEAQEDSSGGQQGSGADVYAADATAQALRVSKSGEQTTDDASLESLTAQEKAACGPSGDSTQCNAIKTQVASLTRSHDAIAEFRKGRDMTKNRLNRIISEELNRLLFEDDDADEIEVVDSGEMEIDDEEGFTSWASQVISSPHLVSYGIGSPNQLPMYADEAGNPVHNAYDEFRGGMSPEGYAAKLAALIAIFGAEMGRENVIRGDFSQYSLDAQIQDTMGAQSLHDIGADYDEAGNLLPAEESEDKYINFTTSDGQVTIDLWEKVSGVDTGFGMVENPHYIEEGEIGHDPDWRRKDGRTVIGVPDDHPRAMPVADAYFELYKEWNDDGYKTPIDDQMGWKPEEITYDAGPWDWDEENLKSKIRSYEISMGWDPQDTDDYVRTTRGYMIRHHEEEEEGEELPAQMGMGRRPSGRHGRGQLSESMRGRWRYLAGIKENE